MGEVDEVEIQPGYWVDRLGNVYSDHSQRYLTLQKTHRGYLQVKLTRAKWFLVHRLVAAAFVNGRSSERNYVNHKDGFKAHNAPGNLEWVTQSENMLHAWESGLLVQTQAMFDCASGKAKRLNPLKRKLSTEQAEEIIRRFSDGDLQYMLANEFNVSPMTISKLVRGISYVAA